MNDNYHIVNVATKIRHVVTKYI